MTEETSEALRRWDALPEGLRHPKNLAMLAIEHLVLPDDHPCRILVLQDADYRNPKVSDCDGPLFAGQPCTPKPRLISI